MLGAPCASKTQRIDLKYGRPSPVSQLKPGSTIGIFGGGQLGRMLAMAAAELGLQTHIYSDVTGPAFDVAKFHTQAPYEDLDAVAEFARNVDVITYEFENVPVTAARAAAAITPVAPGVKALEVAQDRLIEKQFVSRLGIPVAPFANVEASTELTEAVATSGLPARLKTRRMGYDGKGQAQVSTQAELAAAYATMNNAAAILEGFVKFDAEVSVMAVRGKDGTMAFYDLPENTHRDGILDTSTVPAQTDTAVISEAHDIARKIADALDYVGVIAVELFVMPQGAPKRLLVNEIAPRVHNSGHWTLDACQFSQFANHIRAIAGWPVGTTDRHSDALMTNLIGPDTENWAKWASKPQTSVHLYGKGAARPGRKMGHVTELFPRGTK